MKDIILIIVAHPDDESLAMGGTIKKHIDRGDDVFVISMTNGVSSRDNYKLKEIVERKNSALKASSILGFTWGECFEFKDNQMDSYPLLEIVKSIEIVKNNYSPTIVYTHSTADLNIDHRIIANAVITAFRPQPNENCKEIRLFEIPSATDYGNYSITGSFIPNLYISLSDMEFQTKINALKAYQSELREFPHSRSLDSIKFLAKLRGSQVGLNMAEAFEIIRKIDI